MLPVKSNLLPTVSQFFENDWNTLFDWSNRNFTQQVMTLPSVNVKETANDFIVEMAAPGMKKEDFQIELHNNMLTIKSEMEQNEENNNDNYTRKEFSYQSFQRSFNLDHKVVNDAKIKASYNDGLLQVHLPKKEEAKVKPARQIMIS